MEMTEAFGLLARYVDSFELLEKVGRTHVSTGWVPTRFRFHAVSPATTSVANSVVAASIVIFRASAVM